MKGWYGNKQRHLLASKGVKSGRRRGRYESGVSKNLKMNDDVYKLRREAMKYIYEARELCDLPRITIRITDKMTPDKERMYLGLARMEENIIWIPENAIRDKYDLRTIVFHEILHAVFGVPHNKKCKLMKPHHTPLSKKEVEERFIYWVKKSGGKCK